MANTGMNDDKDTRQVQIKLLTKQEQYAVPDTLLSVPRKITSKELNELINGLLQEVDNHERQIEFDFLAEGELLRTSLDEHLISNEVSSERVVQIEYLERLPAPQPQDCMLHDDWISSVHTKAGFILSGSYDTSAHIWTVKGDHKLTIPGPKGAVKAVSWITQGEDQATFLIGGQDQTVLQWRWNIQKDTADCLAIFRGHERCIESVAVNPAGSSFASAGWDGFLKVWSLSAESETGETAPKKSRKDTGGNVGGCQTRTPTMTLKGHRDAVTCVRWISGSDVLTSSWDHTLRIWDIEDGGMKQELIENKAFLSCDQSPISGLILASSADKHIRLFDPRSTEGSIVKQTYTSHMLWVQAVRWSPTHEHLFISGAQDHMVKLWDTRSPRAPLFDLAGHNDKVLCCDWSVPALLVSGGADNALRVFSAPTV